MSTKAEAVIFGCSDKYSALDKSMHSLLPVANATVGNVKATTSKKEISYVFLSSLHIAPLFFIGHSAFGQTNYILRLIE